jgi:hypothetical protein
LHRSRRRINFFHEINLNNNLLEKYWTIGYLIINNDQGVKKIKRIYFEENIYSKLIKIPIIETFCYLYYIDL